MKLIDLLLPKLVGWLLKPCHTPAIDHPLTRACVTPFRVRHSFAG
ncbi:MAG: hypothetical protein ACKODX_23010 [Gemmata sp.]